VGTTASRVGVTIQTKGPDRVEPQCRCGRGMSKAVFATLLSLPMVAFMVPLVGGRRDRKRRLRRVAMGFLPLLLLSGC
jgi:hypothetical protein